jgi:hypothetical protein
MQNVSNEREKERERERNRFIFARKMLLFEAAKQKSDSKVAATFFG